MAIPSTSNLNYYIATPLTNTDWSTNFNQIVAWLTDGNADITFGSLIVDGKSVYGENIANVILSTDFQEITSVSTWHTRTGASITLNNIRATGKVLIIVRSTWQSAPEATLQMRINRDSGTEYVYLSSLTTSNTAGYPIVFVGGTTLFSGLTSGSHTFTVEVHSENDTSLNNCSSMPHNFVFEMIAQEV